MASRQGYSASAVALDERNAAVPLAVSAVLQGDFRAPLVFVLVTIAVVKAVILAASGPFFLPDSGGYSYFADAILDHGRAFDPVVWGAEAIPPFIFRPAGYPLVLALAKLISPAGYAAVAVVFQSLANGLAICLIFAVAARLLRSVRAALLAVALYAGSTSLLWDNTILSDSLYGSLWNIVVFVLLGRLLGYWRLGIAHSVGLGVLWGASLWVRDVGIYFTAFPVMLFALIAARDRWRRGSLASLLAFLVVTSGMAGGIVTLNFYRTGEAFLSITGVENWLRPLFDMAWRGYAQPFNGNDLVSTTVRETVTGYEFDSQLTFIAELHERCRCTPTQMQLLFVAKFRAETWRHPLAYARIVIRNFNYFALGELIADPLATINQFLELGTGTPEARIPGFSLRNLAALRQHFALATLLLMLLSAVAELVSAIVFSAYLLGTPYLLLRSALRRELTIDEVAIGFLWVSFVGACLAFSLVHFEGRHALPVLPAAAVGIVYIAGRLRQRRLRGSA